MQLPRASGFWPLSSPPTPAMTSRTACAASWLTPWEESFWSDVEALHAPQQLQEMDGFGNEMTSTGTEPLVPRVYPAGLARGPLGRLKRQLDPHNTLRANHNIAPEEGMGSPKEEL